MPSNLLKKKIVFSGVRIWSETGKLVGLCAIPIPPKNHKNIFVTSILWFKPDSLIVCDGKNQILEINPQNVDRYVGYFLNFSYIQALSRP